VGDISCDILSLHDEESGERTKEDERPGKGQLLERSTLEAKSAERPWILERFGKNPCLPAICVFFRIVASASVLLRILSSGDAAHAWELPQNSFLSALSENRIWPFVVDSGLMTGGATSASDIGLGRTERDADSVSDRSSLDAFDHQYVYRHASPFQREAKLFLNGREQGGTGN